MAYTPAPMKSDSKFPGTVRAFYLLFSCAVLSSATWAYGSPASNPVAEVLQPYVANHVLAGAVVLWADKDRVLGLDAVVYSDVAKAIPMKTDALFWIASMSKPLTATALMILVDEGKVYRGKRYVSEAAIKEMTTVHTGELLGKSGNGYGLGWSVSDRPHNRGDDLATTGAFGHGGAYSTDMRIDMQHQLITIYLVQHAGYPGDDGGKILSTFRKAALERVEQ